MKKVIVITIFMMYLIISALISEKPNNYQYIFTGEGEFWEAKFITNGTEGWEKVENRITFSNEHSDVLTLTYTGSLEDITFKNLEYSYKTNSSSGSSFSEITNDSTFTHRSSGNGAKVQENEVIQVNVKWNDHEESFELTNKSLYDK
jgi:hypothetical protein